MKARRILRHAVMILNSTLVFTTIIGFFPNLPYSLIAYLYKVWYVTLTTNIIANSFIALYLNGKETSKND